MSDSDSISQGTMANRNGKVFENIMVPIFESNGYKVVAEKEAEKPGCVLPKKHVRKNAKFETIYGHPGVTEFVIVNGERRIRVEAKYQSTTGSVDEKYPYMLLNAILQYPEKEIVFVVDGGGYREGAYNWLKKQIDEEFLDYKNTYGKNIKLMSIAEFMNWFNHGMKN